MVGEEDARRYGAAGPGGFGEGNAAEGGAGGSLRVLARQRGRRRPKKTGQRQPRPTRARALNEAERKEDLLPTLMRVAP